MNKIKYKHNWYLRNKKRLIKIHRDYYESHKESILKKCKEYVKKNKLKTVKYQKEYRKLHHKTILIQHFQARKRRLKNNINFRIRYNLRVRLYKALHRIQKANTTLKLVGCSIEFLKKHLESKFTKGMSWSNYGKWHIDHIKPCASFDLSKASKQRKCFHYTNLQPLWAKDNIRKGSKNE